MQSVHSDDMTPQALLRWYMEAGADEAVGDEPVDRYALSLQRQAEAVGQARQAAAPVARSGNQAPPRPGAVPVLADTPMQAATAAAERAAACQTLEDLRVLVEGFEGCPLKFTATTTVFADGNPRGRLMVIGEGPSRDEDRVGKPFIGPPGQLLDKMLGSIGETRETFYATNVLPWRPPGNRSPTDAEIAICLPFLVRHIELVQPRVLLLLGGLSAKTLFGRAEGIQKLRGHWHSYAAPALKAPVPVLATFHPEYLRGAPAQKRLAWRDLLELKAKLRETQG